MRVFQSVGFFIFCMFLTGDYKVQAFQMQQSCHYDMTAGTDGCSIPDNLGGMLGKYSKLFNPACQGHDRCYSTCGCNQRQCDEDFSANMKAICQVNFIGPELLLCNLSKGAFSVFIQLYGQGAYKHDQKIYGCLD